MKKLFVLTFLLFSACSTSTVVLAPKNNSLPAQIVLNPLVLETEISREHEAAIERITLAALRNRGYLVSARPAAGADAKLPSAQFTVSSLRRDTVIAGHVNRISGTLQFFDPNGTLLAESNHTESERGGLLFNTGQVLKGITSEIDNLEGSAFDDWIERFASQLVGTMPKPTSATVAAVDLAPSIENVQIDRSNTIQQVCFQGETNQNASLRFEATTFPMHEVQSAGKYCVALPSRLLSGSNYSSATIVLESPLGLRATRRISLADENLMCTDLQVNGHSADGLLTFLVACGQQTRECKSTGPCQQFAFRLYEQQSNGAFLLVDEFGLTGLTKPYAGSEPPAPKLFRVFQVNKREQFQKPASFSFDATNGGKS